MNGPRILKIKFIHKIYILKYIGSVLKVVGSRYHDTFKGPKLAMVSSSKSASDTFVPFSKVILRSSFTSSSQNLEKLYNIEKRITGVMNILVL